MSLVVRRLAERGYDLVAISRRTSLHEGTVATMLARAAMGQEQLFGEIEER